MVTNMAANTHTNRDAAPLVVATIGDPCGIGPEVLVKALSTGEGFGRTLLVGDADTVARTIAMTRSPLSMRPCSAFEQARFEPGCIDVLDPGSLRPADITPGHVSPACGRAVVEWWDIATRLAQQGLAKAIVKGPINSEAIRAGGLKEQSPPSGPTHLFLVTGPLRVAHLTDHLTLREMLDLVTRENVSALIHLLDASLKSWGIAGPRIGVAGLNPHCHGPEDREQIAPAVADAAAKGIRVAGPIPADSIFRQCIDGEFDCVLAHYHDQGHVAVKTWRFAGNCALILGTPYVRMSVAHGTAFDIAGKGIADHSSMAAAMRTAAMLSAGKGFPAV
jgi:4-hydroxy-L-threonine phosphate dehydrogenase PdxA